MKILLHFKHFDLSFIQSPQKILLQSEQFKGSKGNFLQLEHNILGKLAFSFSSITITLSASTLPNLNLPDFFESPLLFDFFDFVSSSTSLYLL